MTDPELKSRAREIMLDIDRIRRESSGTREIQELLTEIDQLIRDMAVAIEIRDKTLNLTIAQMTKMVDNQRHAQVPQPS